jgi:hypothetical protein
VRVTGLPANTYIREVRLGAENLIDTGLNLDREPSGRLDIVVGADAGTLDATVLDRSDQRAGGVRVAMVPNAPRRARTDLYRTAVSDDSGVVHFEGVAPGDYKVFAWDRVDSGAWQHPDFIRNYDARGEPALIPPFGSEAVTVRLIATGN